MQKPARAPLFDLNIERVLEHWEVEHALREIIANALDESTLSGTSPISISKDECGRWHIRDYGRGIRIDHFTLNENHEKVATDGVIGKFGVGLKDALATLDRNRVRTTLCSCHGTFTLTKSPKHDFGEITTLHVAHEPAGDPLFRGTDVVLEGVPDMIVEVAKRMFLRFREHQVLDCTPYGQIIAAPPGAAEIFINGVSINTEPSFLFSYNITNLTEAMRKALNRERVDIGRSVYSERVRQMLKAAKAPSVIQPLAAAYRRRDEGCPPEEIRWSDIAHKALSELAKAHRLVVITPKEITAHPELVEDIKREGRQIVLISDKEKQKAEQQALQGGTPFETLRTWIDSVNSSFQYQFVDECHFTESEISIWRMRYDILSLVGLRRSDIPDIRVSQIMRTSNDNVNGVWDSALSSVIIKRSQLSCLTEFAATLLHECAHAVSGASDCTRSFESALTQFLGQMSTNAIMGTRASGDMSAVFGRQEGSGQVRRAVLEDDGEFVPVGSSWIEGVSYNCKSRTLLVAFSNGSRYSYHAVPEAVYKALLVAPSKGRFLSAQIIGRYREARSR